MPASERSALRSPSASRSTSLRSASSFSAAGSLARPLFPVAQVETWRTVLKLLLGVLSAITIFVANYYGRLSLPRSEADHRKMEKFYAFAAATLARNGQAETLLIRLAAEELIENGNWCSYQSDNKPDLNL